MQSKPMTRKIISLKMPAPRRGPDIEYRVVWSEIDAHWEIHRNGAKTSASRRKKQSAIDIAILAARSEEWPPVAKVIVTSLKDRILKTEWVSPSSKSDDV